MNTNNDAYNLLNDNKMKNSFNDEFLMHSYKQMSIDFITFILMY
jgi:hypothetical protein